MINETILGDPQDSEYHLSEPLSKKTPGLNAALAKARGEFPDIPRTRIATIKMKNGGQYSYKYANLADVFRAIDPALAAYGLLVMQWPEGDSLHTLVAHESGEQRVTQWPIKALPQQSLDTAQAFQSAIQVAKRYALTAALGISTEETIEGDARGHKVISPQPVTQDPFIENDGIRAPVGAKVNAKMSKREMAEESARAIEAQFDEVKTVKGLNGVWNRNERFIEVFKERHDDLFQNIYDHFNSMVAKLEVGE